MLGICQKESISDFDYARFGVCQTENDKIGVRQVESIPDLEYVGFGE